MGLLGLCYSMEVNSRPVVARGGVSRGGPVGAGEDEHVACYELPGSRVTCGSHCWPFCEAPEGGQHPDAMDYNHYIVIPEARTCYIDTLDYGRFDAFLS